MADILRSVADRLRGAAVINYSDNLAILLPEGAGAGERHAIVEPLRDAFAKHPAGPFFLTTSGPRPLSSPFKFLGYRWVRDGEGAARAFVDPETLDERATLYRYEMLFPRGRSARRRDQIRGYQAAFALCADTKAAFDALLAELDDAAREGV